MLPRRQFLLAGAAAATVGPERAVDDRERKPASQDELDEAVRLHAMWLANINTGQRCVFGGRDLSGLQFGALGGQPLNLTGADFAQANLSGTEADDILIHHCNFNGAEFDDCHWRRPVFAYADMRRVSAKRVKWGTPAYDNSTVYGQADLAHAVLTDADLTEAQIRGCFYGTRMGGSTLVRANFCNSDFLGPKYHEMSFAGANLSDAHLRDCRIASVTFFRANCSGTDFSRAVLSDVRMKDCNLSGARFRGADIASARFSDDQIRQMIF
jgi:uncharacterized protein YjbI with pentapeptide repeats